MEYQEILDMALKTILIPAITLVGLLIKTWVTAQIEVIKERSDKERVKFYLDQVNDLILTSVSDVKGVYVDALKKDNAFTKEAQTEAFEMAKNKVMSQLKYESVQILESVYLDYRKMIESKIEAAVEDLKNYEIAVE